MINPDANKFNCQRCNNKFSLIASDDRNDLCFDCQLEIFRDTKNSQIFDLSELKLIARRYQGQAIRTAKKGK